MVILEYLFGCVLTAMQTIFGMILIALIIMVAVKLLKSKSTVEIYDSLGRKKNGTYRY